MHIHVNGTRLFFDVDGPELVPHGAEMRERPIVVVLHGGPGAFDHSLYKQDLWQLTDVAQVVYLDLRGHGRSAHNSDEPWSLALWADDVRAFCEALAIDHPVVWDHSFGSFVAATYAARHPEHPRALVLQNTLRRADLDRITEGFRRAGGDEVAAIARRFFSGDTSVFEDFLTTVAPVYGPWVPGEEDMARTIMNVGLINACADRLDLGLQRAGDPGELGQRKPTVANQLAGHGDLQLHDSCRGEPPFSLRPSSLPRGSATRPRRTLRRRCDGGGACDRGRHSAP